MMPRSHGRGSSLDQIVAPPDTDFEREPEPTSPRRAGRGAWVLVISVWGLAFAVGGTLFWVLPKAASSRDLGRDAFALQLSVSRAQLLLDQAKARLSAIQAELDALESTRTELQAEAGKNGQRIQALNERIDHLRAEKKAAEAAAAAAASAEAAERGGGGGGISVPPPPPPPTPCYTVFTTDGTPYLYCPSFSMSP